MLTLTQIVFLVAAAITLLAAFMVVTCRSMVHAALWLIMALAGVAVFFVLLSLIPTWVRKRLGDRETLPEDSVTKS